MRKVAYIFDEPDNCSDCPLAKWVEIGNEEYGYRCMLPDGTKEPISLFTDDRPTDCPLVWIAYACDREQCPDCSHLDCEHTTDITHAKNFECVESHKYIEKQEDQKNGESK